MDERIESVEIKGLTWEAVGVGLGEDGRRIHVYGAIPGERGWVALKGSEDDVPYGRVRGLVRAHPERVEAACPDFGSCFRCPMMPFPEAVQDQVRRRLVQRLWAKVARLSGGALPEPAWSLPERPARWARRVRYRYRVRLGEPPTVGFTQPDRITVHGVEGCSVVAAPLGALPAQLREAFAGFPLDGSGQVVAAVDDAAGGDPRAVVCVRAEDGHFPDPDWCEALARRDWPVRGGLLLDREGRERFRWGDPTYAVLSGTDGAPALRATVGRPIEDAPEVERAALGVLDGWLSELDLPSGRALECFAGVGARTRLLHRHMAFVEAITTPAEAVDDLHANFASVPRERVRRSYASLARGLARAYRKPGQYDLVCVWAPIRGAVGLWRTLREVEVPRLITSHAGLQHAGPDMKRILDVGFAPERIHAIAAEPHRGRVELIVSWRPRV